MAVQHIIGIINPIDLEIINSITEPLLATSKKKKKKLAFKIGKTVAIFLGKENLVVIKGTATRKDGITALGHPAPTFVWNTVPTTPQYLGTFTATPTYQKTYASPINVGNDDFYTKAIYRSTEKEYYYTNFDHADLFNDVQEFSTIIPGTDEYINPDGYVATCIETGKHLSTTRQSYSAALKFCRDAHLYLKNNNDEPYTQGELTVRKEHLEMLFWNMASYSIVTFRYYTSLTSFTEVTMFAGTEFNFATLFLPTTIRTVSDPDFTLGWGSVNKHRTIISGDIMHIYISADTASQSADSVAITVSLIEVYDIMLANVLSEEPVPNTINTPFNFNITIVPADVTENGNVLTEHISTVPVLGNFTVTISIKNINPISPIIVYKDSNDLVYEPVLGSSGFIMVLVSSSSRSAEETSVIQTSEANFLPQVGDTIQYQAPELFLRINGKVIIHSADAYLTQAFNSVLTGYLSPLRRRVGHGLDYIELYVMLYNEDTNVFAGAFLLTSQGMISTGSAPTRIVDTHINDEAFYEDRLGANIPFGTKNIRVYYALNGDTYQYHHNTGGGTKNLVYRSEDTITDHTTLLIPQGSLISDTASSVTVTNQYYFRIYHEPSITIDDDLKTVGPDHDDDLHGHTAPARFVIHDSVGFMTLSFAGSYELKWYLVDKEFNILEYCHLSGFNSQIKVDLDNYLKTAEDVIRICELYNDPKLYLHLRLGKAIEDFIPELDEAGDYLYQILPADVATLENALSLRTIAETTINAATIHNGFMSYEMLSETFSRNMPAHHTTTFWVLGETDA